MPSFNYAVTAYPQARLLSKAGFVDLDRIVYEYPTRYLDSEITKRGKSPRHDRDLSGPTDDE